MSEAAGHAYVVKPKNGHLLLVCENGDDAPDQRQLESLEAVAAAILEAELGIEVDGGVVEAFASEVLSARLPHAKVTVDQLWEWLGSE